MSEYRSWNLRDIRRALGRHKGGLLVLQQHSTSLSVSCSGGSLWIYLLRGMVPNGIKDDKSSAIRLLDKLIAFFGPTFPARSFSLQDARRVVARSLDREVYVYIQCTEDLPAVEPEWATNESLHITVHVGHDPKVLAVQPYRVSMRGTEALAALDRLIQVLGPDWPNPPPEKAGMPDSVSAEDGDYEPTETDDMEMEERVPGAYRPKGTDEAAPTSGDPSEDASLHGGDGNSGECDHRADTTSSEPRDQSGCDESAAPEGNEDGESEDSCGAPPEGATEEAKSRTDKPTSEGSAPPTSESSDSSDNPKRDAEGVTGDESSQEAGESSPACDEGGHVTPSPAGEVSDPSDSEEQGASDDQAQAEPLPAASSTMSWDSAPRTKASPGGQYLDTAAVAKALRDSAKPAAKDVKRSLERLIKTLDAGGLEESPRLDGRRLCKELVSKRYAVQRAKRRDLQHAVIILAVDVSGSCSACCSELYACAFALAAVDPNVIIVQHSNGYTGDIGQPLDTGIAEYARRIAKTRRIAAVVAFGDWDAGEEYRELCENGADLYWLDSYAACSGAKPASHNLTAQARGWTRQPKAWWQGVNNAKTTAIALRQMAKSAK